MTIDKGPDPDEGWRREDWERKPVARIHGHSELPHSLMSYYKPHTHLLVEDAPVGVKNLVATHIETYHGNRRT